MDAVIDKARIKIKAPVVKSILEALSERDEEADICKDKDGTPEAVLIARRRECPSLRQYRCLFQT